MATGFGYDPHDSEWETGSNLRTVYRPGEDDGYCEVCDTDLTVEGFCVCDEAAVA